MNRRLRSVAAGLLVAMAFALVFGIAAIHHWGGRVETLLSIFGERMWVTLDAGRPRFLLLFVVPGVLLAAAFSLWARRRRE